VCFLGVSCKLSMASLPVGNVMIIRSKLIGCR
jgi:hypothetical protein